MNMINVNVLIKPDETPLDIIEEICDECGIGPDEPFAFSAIVAPDKHDKDCQYLKINCLEQTEDNPFSPDDIVTSLFKGPYTEKPVRYIQPPIEQWITVFRPLLMKLVSRAHPRYERLIPDRDELVSIIYLVVMRLYNQGYYLHQTLIYKSFINELNLECRKLKGLSRVDSLDAPIGQDDDGKDITLMDQLADPSPCPFEYTEEDFWANMFEQIKAYFLEEMSELSFEHILFQLRTNTVDRKTSYQLDKCRETFNPNYVPRPNARGKNRGGKKK